MKMKGKTKKGNLSPWNNSLPDQDPFSILVSGTEGGFLSLEEIDESEFNAEAASDGAVESMERKERSDDGVESFDVGTREKKRKKTDSLKGKKKKKLEEKQIGGEECVNEDEKGKEGDDSGGEDDTQVWLDDFNAWNDLRLHPLLMKSICRLGFTEPTPIQKACIPAAAHQGKDVIGAAETGSGKTLAFGLPILQRLLEEQEKASRFLEKGKISQEASSERPLRALIITPTRELALQVTDHLNEVAKSTSFKAVPVVGGMYAEKQERLLNRKPAIVVGTPGRLWELMSGGNRHLVELHSLSFFILDEADRMIENGHFHELHSIIDMLPQGSIKNSENSEDCSTILKLQRKKRQTCVFSATIALSDNFRKKLKKGFSKGKTTMTGGLTSIETLSELAGMRPDVAIVDLTNNSIIAERLEESFIECTEENKDLYLYYIVSVHGQGRTMVFCTSVTALFRISSLLRILGIGPRCLHSQMRQKARLKAIDQFRRSKSGILIATDVAARGLDIPGVRTVVHYQLPHSSEVYIHRSGRTARAGSDGCSIALISPTDRAKFFSLCRSLSKDNLLHFPVDDAYMLEISKHMSLSRQIDKLLRKASQDKAKNSWVERNAEALGVVFEKSDSEEEIVQKCKQQKALSFQLQKLKQELEVLLAKPLQPKHFSHKFLAGGGVSTTLQKQLEEWSKIKQDTSKLAGLARPKVVVIGQDCIEPLQALRTSGHQVSLNNDKIKEKRKLVEIWKKKKQEAKKHEHDVKRKRKKASKLRSTSE